MTRRVRCHYKKKYVYAFVSDRQYERVKKLHWQYVDGYAIHYYKDKKSKRITHFSMHRFVTGCKFGDGIEIDHKDRNKLNNTDENLRKCTHQQNLQNTVRLRKGVSGYRGVFWDAEMSKWAASIQYDGKQHKIGRFNTKIEAALAYDREARLHHGEFAVTNFKDDGAK